jgi:general stress protein YciG
LNTEDKPKTSPVESGRKGGNSTKEKYGLEHFSEMGKKGGGTTAERHGREHYVRIGKLHAKRADDVFPETGFRSCSVGPDADGIEG